MTNIYVPEDERPSYLKYAVLTLAGLVIVSGFVATVARTVESPVVGLVAGVAAALANLSILFLMIQSLVEEWFEAAEVAEG